MSVKRWGRGWVEPRDSSPVSGYDLGSFDEAFEILHAGVKPWGWQREAAAGVFSRVSGHPLYSSFVIMAQRQEGKTALSESLLTTCLLEGMVVAYAWHERKLGRVRLLRLADKLEKELPGIQVIRSQGYESVSLGRGRIDLMTATDAGARGDSYDMVLVDEALEASTEFVAAVVPTMSTSAREQMVYISSAGKPTSDALRDAYEQALSDIESGRHEPGGFGCYVLGATEEQAADDPYDEEMWAAIMPTLGLPGGVKLSSVRADARRMKLGEFKRERLGIWSADDEQAVMTDEQIDAILGDEYVPDFQLR